MKPPGAREVLTDMHGVTGYTIEIDTTKPKTGSTSTVVMLATVTKVLAIVASTISAEWCPSDLDDVVHRVQNSLTIKA
jgi:methyl coenzyme M reductase subunit C